MSIALSTQFSDGESRRSPRLAAAAQEPDAIDIRRGLRRGEFQAYVQPKFDLQSQAVQGVEVLARWHSQRGLMTPAAFIYLMTREQLLDELLSSLLAQGLACQVELHRQGRELSFAFNLSLHQLASDSLVDQLAARLQQHPLPLSSVTLEITEDAFTSVSPAVQQRLVCLKELGVRLSMDDFGTGYSSLWRLNQLPFDEIKLAREFTAQLESSPRARAIVRHALFLAEDLGMQLIVEGIETQSQRSLLMQLGACFGQGYLCAEPMPVDSLGTWLKRSHQPF
ncbi:EAL domain-containing protein [Pseudomonas sp. GW456-L14]|uniref:EAL domain-containing protein n=1 Tax=unclassified Pseudomonas TaxID=196821 RepID=UPI000C88BC02|nr:MULTISPECIES: EAL domain-containing protein [unclassified Pseudomonas]PMY42025.1 EAL domain-containing protein [Pseudomonas sp. GW456-L14]PMY58757.1 EAL domain-containing protein [Pseudomonas sp. GW456-L12]